MSLEKLNVSLLTSLNLPQEEKLDLHCNKNQHFTESLLLLSPLFHSSRGVRGGRVIERFE